MRLVVRFSFFLFQRKMQRYPFYLGAVTVAVTMLWLPWYIRMVTFVGLAMITYGIELETTHARIDGAQTMEMLIEMEGNGRVR